MSLSRVEGFRIAGVSTCVPARTVDNVDLGKDYGADEVRKVVAMAGVQYRHVVDAGTTSADLCYEAAARLLAKLGWAPETVTGLIMVTQSPDYFLPSSACMIHKWLGLSDQCAAFDVGLGCSGYPYGLYLAATMLKAGGHGRILMLHGETPSLFPSADDHATTLLFGDAGSATALEASTRAEDHGIFALHTDGSGYDGLIMRGGGFRDRNPANARDRHLFMDGGAIFNFTIKRVPALIRDTLAHAQIEVTDVDWYLFHQSNRFIMKHLAKKCGLPDGRVPFVLDRFGNSGGPSVALALTQGVTRGEPRSLRVMMLGYGVGLSWGSALTQVGADTPLLHGDYTGSVTRQ
jgi:3-oxoacyl-[acyl-carrier-protein] synthase III